MTEEITNTAWTEFSSNISAQESRVFLEAVGSLVGIEYTPVAVARQGGADVNYCFFCNARTVYPGADSRPVTIMIFKPLGGHSHIIEIKSIDFEADWSVRVKKAKA